MIVNPYIIQSSHKSTNNINKECDLNDLTQKIKSEIISKYLENLSKFDEVKIKNKIMEYIYDRFKKLTKKEIENIASNIIDDIFGYGILQKYITDEVTTDIRVVSYNSIYLKQVGNWVKSPETFVSEVELEEYIRYCVFKNSAVINNETPIVTLSDRKYNLRIEAGIKPVNVNSSNIVIRIHKNNEEKTMESLMAIDDMFDTETYKFLLESVINEKNIIICGRGGSGKTTLLRAIIEKIPSQRSIVSSEETAELNIKNKNIIQREVVSNRSEDKKIDLDLLTRHALVMSCETIILGELKSSEANVFFDAISTGHNGYATVHADSTKNTIDRIIVLIKKDIRAQGYKEEFLRQLLASSIDYIIYMEKYKIDTVSKVTYNKLENGVVTIDIIKRKYLKNVKSSYIIKKEETN